MIKTTLKFALRSFKKSKWIHVLNTLGLTLGLAVFFLVSLFIYQENTFEQDFSKRDRIFQIGSYMGYPDKNAKTTSNLAYVLEDQPEIESLTFFDKYPKDVFEGENVYESQDFLFVDSMFFEVFDFELSVGDRSSILDVADRALINEKTAIQLFGTLDVIGKEIRYVEWQENFKTVTIAGIIKAPKFKTQLDFDFLISRKRSPLRPKSWLSWGPNAYALAKPAVTKDQIAQRLDLITQNHVFPNRLEKDYKTFEDWKASDRYYSFHVHSLNELRSEQIFNGLMPLADSTRIKTLSVIGLVALIIAIINFFNLSTARASVRMKEIGLKRILGSTKKQLILQFLLESFVLVVIAVLLALGAVEGFVKWQPESFGGFIEYSMLQSTEWGIGLITFVLFLSIITGIYPALYLSNRKVIGLLNNGSTKNSFSMNNAKTLRQTTTVVQFVFSIGLIAAVLTMFTQVRHLRNTDLGYDQEQVIVINNPNKVKDREVFKEELKRIPGVLSAAYTQAVPSNPEGNGMISSVEAESGENLQLGGITVDATFFETMGMKFIEGENFNTSLKNDRGQSNRNVIITESAKSILDSESFDDPYMKDLNVIGVVEDFIMKDFKSSIAPMIFRQRIPVGFDPWWHDPLVVKVSDLYGSNVMVEIEEVWSGLSGLNMKWYPLDQNTKRLIDNERTTFNLILLFSLFAILIACVGLFGLAAFTVDERTKEFGIRKVLGASLSEIAKHFSWGFIKLIVIAFFLAMPISIYFLNDWLAEFSQRIEISCEIPLITAVVTLSIVLITILAQSLRAGRLNPVDTLRNE